MRIAVWVGLTASAVAVASAAASIATESREFRVEGIPSISIPAETNSINGLLTLGLLGTAAALLSRPASVSSSRRRDDDYYGSGDDDGRRGRLAVMQHNIRRNLRHNVHNTKQLISSMATGTVGLAHLGVSGVAAGVTGVARGARAMTSAIAGLGSGMRNGLRTYGEVYNQRRMGSAVARRRSGYFAPPSSRRRSYVGRRSGWSHGSDVDQMWDHGNGRSRADDSWQGYYW